MAVSCDIIQFGIFPVPIEPFHQLIYTCEMRQIYHGKEPPESPNSMRNIDSMSILCTAEILTEQGPESSQLHTECVHLVGGCVRPQSLCLGFCSVCGFVFTLVGHSFEYVKPGLEVSIMWEVQEAKRNLLTTCSHVPNT